MQNSSPTCMVAQGADHQINVIDLPEGGFAVDTPSRWCLMESCGDSIKVDFRPLCVQLVQPRSSDLGIQHDTSSSNTSLHQSMIRSGSPSVSSYRAQPLSNLGRVRSIANSRVLIHSLHMVYYKARLKILFQQLLHG